MNPRPMDYDSTALPTELPRPGFRGVGYTSGRGDLSSAAMHSLSGGSALNCIVTMLSVHREVIVVVIHAIKAQYLSAPTHFETTR